MESLDWHNRLIDRLIKNNPEATIADYFRITDGYKPTVEKSKAVPLTNTTPYGIANSK